MIKFDKSRNPDWILVWTLRVWAEVLCASGNAIEMKILSMRECPKATATLLATDVGERICLGFFTWRSNALQ